MLQSATVSIFIPSLFGDFVFRSVIHQIVVVWSRKLVQRNFLRERLLKWKSKQSSLVLFHQRYIFSFVALKTNYFADEAEKLYPTFLKRVLSGNRTFMMWICRILVQISNSNFEIRGFQRISEWNRVVGQTGAVGVTGGSTRVTRALLLRQASFLTWVFPNFRRDAVKC